jgi:NTP pyrophosphatase (non-canonical NTP hydrolase)
MKHTFEELYKFQLHNQGTSAWSLDEPLQERAEELKEEVNEMLEDLNNNDMEGFKDELGDVLWNTLALIAKAELQGTIKPKELMEHTLQKFKRRKPFLLTGEKVSKDEENRIWEEIKEKERNEKRNKTA